MDDFKHFQMTVRDCPLTETYFARGWARNLYDMRTGMIEMNRTGGHLCHRCKKGTKHRLSNLQPLR